MTEPTVQEQMIHDLRLLQRGLAAIVALSVTIPAQASSTADVLAHLPAIGGMALSPSGNRILMLRAIDGTYHLAVVDLAAHTNELVLAADKTKFTLSWCGWANEGRILCSIAADSRNQSQLGRRQFGFKLSRLLAVDADGKNAEMLIRQRPRPGNGQFPQIQDRIVSWLPARRDEVLIELDQESPLEPSVYRLDIRRNKLKKVQGFRAGIRSWYADGAGNVRLGVGYVNGKPAAIVVDGRKRRRFDLATMKASLPPNVYGVSADGRYALLGIAPDDAPTIGLHRYALATGQLQDTLIEDPDYDFLGRVSRTRDGVVRGARWVRDAPLTTWFDDRSKKRFEEISSALGDPTLAIVGASTDANRLLVHTVAAAKVPSWYLYDATQRTLTKLADDYRLPDGAVLAPVQSIRYPARDGTPIPAYLTRPVGRDGPLPAVIIPHGGPYERDALAFDYWRQFLAAEGYVVLQPNFRGSAGFGIDWLTAGFGEWGRLMQQDVIDGLDWLTEQGIADPKRICMVGGSYGGFVALTAAWQTPERIRCAVSFAGVTDLVDLMRNVRLFDLGDLFITRIADTPEQVARAKAVSAVRHAQEIAVPLLIVHGDADRTVPVTQSRELAERLEGAGRTFRYIEQPGGDHHLTLEDQRLEFFGALRDFLAEHIGRPEAAQ